MTQLHNISLLSSQEQALRISKLNLGPLPALITEQASIFYLTGRVFAGYILLHNSQISYYIKRPSSLQGDNITLIRKPEDISLPPLPALGLELSSLPYAAATRLAKALQASNLVDISGNILDARSIKTPLEIEMLRLDGRKQAEVYTHIPALFRPGMTDLELQIEIERIDRLHGCLGQFRIHGNDMELHMANVLTGHNADTPSPYDFAMGGAGISPSLPIGACGETIRPGQAVMVDLNANFNGYMTDMTRTYACGQLPDEAIEAHNVSRQICREIAAAATPGTPTKDLYNLALEIATQAGLAAHFMGHRAQAGFVGHGVGIEINELPVLAPRSKHLMQAGNVIALEPKFVIPSVGAVGIENTYVCTPSGLECITPAPEEIIQLL